MEEGEREREREREREEQGRERGRKRRRGRERGERGTIKWRKVGCVCEGATLKCVHNFV